jgi:hypothetical protein
MSVTIAAFTAVFVVAAGAVVDPVEGVDELEQPVASDAMSPTATTAPTYVTHFDLTEISLLYTGHEPSHSF